MRLIDADKLIDNLDAMIPDYDYSDTSMGIATAIQEVGRMAFYEEVKAIPIEWLKEWEGFEQDLAIVNLRDIVSYWGKENETNRR